MNHVEHESERTVSLATRRQANNGRGDLGVRHPRNIAICVPACRQTTEVFPDETIRGHAGEWNILFGKSLVLVLLADASSFHEEVQCIGEHGRECYFRAGDPVDQCAKRQGMQIGR